MASTLSHLRNFHRPYIEELHQQGYQVDVACGNVDGTLDKVDRIIEIPFTKSMTSPRNIKAMQVLRREMAANQYELISCHTALASFFVRLGAMLLPKRPKILTICHGYLFDDDTPFMKKRILCTAEAMTAPVTDLLLTMNQWDYTYATTHKLGKEIIKIPGMGVDFSQFDEALQRNRASLRKNLSLPENVFLLVYAAEFSSRKNQMQLIKSMQLLPKEIMLVLLGDGALLEPCRNEAEVLGLSDRVILAGHRKDVALYYAAADAAVSSSRSEGLPFNVMEAMYCGLPVIATNVKGHLDLVDHGRTGYLFPYDDAAAFADYVRSLFEQPELRYKMGQAAHQDALQFDIERVKPLVMEQISKLLPITAQHKEY